VIGKTILLVEDEAIIAMTEAMTLKKYGCQVVTVYSGEQALEAMAGPPAVDLVLMDIDLGARRMDGTQAARLILQQRRVPIIFLSSHTEREIVEKTEGITSYGYIVKDSGETVLVASIKMAFKLHAAYEALEHANDRLALANDRLAHANDRLERANEKLHLSLEASHAGTWDWDIANDSFDCSPEFLRLFGLPADPPSVFDAWLRAVHPDDRDIAARRIQECIDQHIDLLNDYRILLPSGEVRWMRATGQACYDGPRPVRMTGLCIDITERKQAERALAHSHDLLRYVIEHSRSAIAIHDRQLNYIYVSQRYLDEYRVSARDVIGRHHYAVFPDLPQKWREVHRRALAGEVSSAENDPYVRADGSVDWTRWECRPWYEADGSIGGIIVYTEVVARSQVGGNPQAGTEYQDLYKMQPDRCRCDPP